MDNYKNNPYQKGFTLIELLVVAVLISIVIGATFAGYRNFDRTQRVRQAALTLKNNLRLAQTKAIAIDKPLGCEDFRGVEFSAATSQYVISHVCGSDKTEYTKVILPSGMTITSASVTFQPISGGVTTDQKYTLTSGATLFEVTVTVNGLIDCQKSGGSGPCY